MIEAVERQLAEAEAQLADSEAAVSRLDDERMAAEGRVAITRRAVADLHDRLTHQREALEGALRAAAVEQHARAVDELDAARSATTIAARALISAYADVEAARGRVNAAAEEAVRRGAKVPSNIESAAIGDEERIRLHEILDVVTQARLDEELLTAAAASPLGAAIRDLPPHLQSAARARRSRDLRDSRKR